MQAVVPLSEDTTLAEALAQCVAKGHAHVAVKSGWDEIVGVVASETLGRLAARVPEVPLKLVPLEQACCAPATERLSAVVNYLRDPEVRFVLVETENRVLLGALRRDELAAIDDWAPLRRAHKQRTGESVEGLPPVLAT